jgi:polar amino acid transport system substrate-binding protein
MKITLKPPPWLASALLALACLTSSLSSNALHASESLRWAADTESGAPLVFQDPKNPSQILGFEREVIEGVAARLGRKPVLIHNSWEGLVPGLARGNYEIIVNGLEITDERKKQVLFSDPYFITTERIAVRADEERIHSLDDLKGKKVGTLRFSIAERILRETGGIDVVTYESELTAYEDLKYARTDAVLLDEPLAVYNAQPNPALKLVDQRIGSVPYGIAMSKKNQKLQGEINAALAEMVKSGELRRIYDRYNVWNPILAAHWGDTREALEPPTRYEEFLESTSHERTFKQRIELYVSFLPILAKGAMITLGISLAAMALAVGLGLVLALIRLYGPKPLSVLSMLYIELIRGTPLLIQLFFIFYALPGIGIKLSPFIAAVLGLGLNYAAYEAENYRAGILGVPKSQAEAGLALGLNQRQTLRYIVVPQAFRIVLPPITNDFISLLKDSSLVSIITMVELTKLYGQLAATYYDYLGTGILVAGFYLLLGLPFVRLARFVEEKLAVGEGPKQRSKFPKKFFPKN